MAKPRYFNARYYDPTLGRFINEDPSRKGTGWYTYCSNHPVNRIDPTGLDVGDPGKSGFKDAIAKAEEEVIRVSDGE